MADVLKAAFIRNFKDLEVYRRSYAISLDIHKTSLFFPQIEQYSIAGQIRRASKSICANIGEGHAKQLQSKSEFRRFLLMAIGSCNEMIIWSDYCKDLNYINIDTWNIWNREYEIILKMLHKLRISIE